MTELILLTVIFVYFLMEERREMRKAFLPVVLLFGATIGLSFLIGTTKNTTPVDQLPAVVWVQGSEQVQADALVVYSASWCPPCKAFKKRVLIPLASEGYSVEIRDIDPRRPISKSSVGKCKLTQVKPGDYKPRSVPTFYLFAGSQKVNKGGLSTGSSLDSFRQRLKKKNTEN